MDTTVVVAATLAGEVAAVGIPQRAAWEVNVRRMGDGAAPQRWKAPPLGIKFDGAPQ